MSLAGVEVQIGDADDQVRIRSLAFQYDLTLPDNVTCPSI